MSAESADILYAIPSYRRSKIIQTHTLTMLWKNNIPKDRIVIFVSDQKDFLEYELALGGEYKVVLTPSRDLVEKFNAVHRYFPAGQRVVFVEDDIFDLKWKTGENKLEPFTDLQKMAESSFADCLANGTALWGISSNANPFYMKDGRSVGFKSIVANLFGFISTLDPFLEISHLCKSDYERTLLYYIRYGSVVRNDGVCAVTTNYKTPGGLQEMNDRADKEELACTRLVKRFPHLVAINEKKSKISMYMELKMITQKKKQLQDLMAMQKILDRRP